MPHISSAFIPAAAHATYLCRIAAYTAVAIALGWFSYFIWSKEWDLAVSLIILAFVTLPCWVMAMRGLFFRSLLIAQITCLLFVGFFCYRYDVSNQLFQRSTHLYIPTIALVGYISYQQTKSKFQIFIILISLVLFILFSSNVHFLSMDNSTVRHFQMVSSWINPLLSTLLFVGVIVAMHTDFSKRKKSVKAIQNALYNDQFILLYQPVVNLKGRVTGAEALIRWNHPSSGLISPVTFIPDAQQAGMMPMIGEWVIAQAFNDLLRWQENAETRHLTVSINITTDHFMQPDFVRKLLQQAQVKNIPCRQVRLELTESVFISEPHIVAAKMDELAAAGFTFALDDFGTGFSALSTLRKLPLNQIKIDRSFVTGASTNTKGVVIARNIARMGTELGLEVVAEGIETPYQWSIMKEYGCTVFQGFLFSRPVSVADFILFVSSHSHHDTEYSASGYLSHR
ncbi:bifunctional diguanylate cyclase/phosphodiesterase [uncultured Cedecea sp.]|uniref:putative bifunctional diguanylate cyclase/phosphodiesterase n=1 Tax=uncultured Cedecea sp. TaxID=988762 RepID=UPI00261B60C8|nr:EAL domain-containing protein [uncultured Cedecea sp.]